MSFPLLRVDVANVSASFAGKPALRSAVWALEYGEHWAVLGGNGAGKSTLLRLVRGDIRPDQMSSGASKGRITWTIDGVEDCSPLAIKPVARLVSAEQHRMYVRKEWNMTGLGLISSGFADSLLSAPMTDVEQQRALAVAKSFNASHLLDKPITAMSQGQLRLVLLARALASSPRLLLLDEPFDGLDAAARKTLHAAVAVAAKTALVVTTAHRPEDIPECVTHVAHLEKGRVVWRGLKGSEAHSRFLSSCDGACERENVFSPIGASPAKGDPGVSAVNDAGAAAFSYSLELENVNVYVDRVKILHGLTWKLPAGENWRVSGPNGSGKSTLLRLVAGFEQAALGGKLVWRGAEHPPLEKRLRETGYLSDRLHAAYTYDLTGLDLVLSGFDGSVGLWRKPAKKEREEALHWIDFFGLSSMARTPVSRFSSGTARRFFLARALVGPVRLLVLDEPCSGLDRRARDTLLAALEAVMAGGVQCLYVSHHDADVPARITHELVLEHGKIVRSGLLARE